MNTKDFIAIEEEYGILTEGFKRAGKPAIEILRQRDGFELVGEPEQLIAIASDAPGEVWMRCMSGSSI